MKNKFPGYYDIEKDRFKELWENSDFIFDANVLLDLYRYSKESSIYILKLLENMNNDRLWIPYQVASEYLKNRNNVIRSQIKIYVEFENGEKVINQMIKKKITEEINKFKSNPKMEKRHSFLKNIPEIMKDLEGEFENISETIKDVYRYEKFIEFRQYKNYYTKLLEDDYIFRKFTKIFENNVGDDFDIDEKERIFEEGERRYKNQIPPGYMDAVDKEFDNKFGDLVLWKQMIQKSIKDKKPIIFITNDNKEDWWLKDGKKVIGPRPELINEINKIANVPFYMFSFVKFIEFLVVYKIVDENKLDNNKTEKAIEEVLFIKNTDIEQNRENLETLLSKIFGLRNGRIDPYQKLDDLYYTFKNLLNDLPELEKEIIMMKYGLKDGKIYEKIDICEKFDLDDDDFINLEAKALRMIRHPKRSRILEKYLWNTK